eukprot:7677468-Pyramimonas_sp.AAC.1
MEEAITEACSRVFLTHLIEQATSRQGAIPQNEWDLLAPRIDDLASEDAKAQLRKWREWAQAS